MTLCHHFDLERSLGWLFETSLLKLIVQLSGIILALYLGKLFRKPWYQLLDPFAHITAVEIKMAAA